MTKPMPFDALRGPDRPITYEQQAAIDMARHRQVYGRPTYHAQYDRGEALGHADLRVLKSLNQGREKTAKDISDELGISIEYTRQRLNDLKHWGFAHVTHHPGNKPAIWRISPVGRLELERNKMGEQS